MEGPWSMSCTSLSVNNGLVVRRTVDDASFWPLAWNGMVVVVDCIPNTHNNTMADRNAMARLWFGCFRTCWTVIWAALDGNVQIDSRHGLSSLSLLLLMLMLLMLMLLVALLRCRLDNDDLFLWLWTELMPRFTKDGSGGNHRCTSATVGKSSKNRSVAGMERRGGMVNDLVVLYEPRLGVVLAMPRLGCCCDPLLDGAIGEAVIVSQPQLALFCAPLVHLNGPAPLFRAVS